MSKDKGRAFGLFVTRQVQRAEALPTSMGYTFSEAAQTEIANYLIDRVAGRAEVIKQSDLQWLEESPGARKVKAAMDEIMQGDQAPTIASVRATWERLYSASKPINYNCPECGGSGWAEIVAGSVSGAMRCKRGCAVPPDRLDAHVGGNDADSAANSAWAELVGAEIADKLKKPIVVTEPPKLERLLTDADFGDVDHFKP